MITRIILTDASAFVITARSKNNSEFYIRSKNDFERELELKELNENAVVISTTEGMYSESDIINMINSGKGFYTYCYSDKSFTEIDVVNDNIRSIANETKEDNIQKLPLI